MRLKDRLIELRNLYGKSTLEVSRGISESQMEYEKWEKGYRVPSQYSINKIATFYNLEPDEIYVIKRAYKLRLIAQRVQANYLKYMFLTLIITLLVSWFLSFTVNLGFGIYNSSREQDYVDHHLRVLNEDDLVIRYRFYSSVVDYESLDSFIIVEFTVPDHLKQGVTPYSGDSLEGLIVENNTDIEITSFEFEYNPNGENNESFIVQMTLGDAEGRRFATSGYFSFDISDDFIFVAGNEKIFGDIIVHGGEDDVE